MAVNHVWARHFGRPLVGNMFDFGHNGQPPTHPALLDWLAAEFVARGWSLKHLHRLIVTSDAYTRRSTPSGPDDPNLASDPDNIHYWRMNARRMEAEAVRDNLLSAAGMLDPTLGGPDLDPGLGMISRRRSLYFRHAKEKRAVFLKVFDSPSAIDCYRRVESVMPQQALALANSPLAIERRGGSRPSSRKDSVADPHSSRRRSRPCSAECPRTRNARPAKISWTIRPGGSPTPADPVRRRPRSRRPGRDRPAPEGAGGARPRAVQPQRLRDDPLIAEDDDAQHRSGRCDHATRLPGDVGMGFTGLALGAMLHRDGIARGDESAGHRRTSPRRPRTSSGSS